MIPRLHSLDELIETLEFMTDWRDRLDRQIKLFQSDDFDLLLLTSEVKAWLWAAKNIEKAIKR
jgi:hypothetical protein